MDEAFVQRIDAATERLRESVLVPHGRLEGCTDAEIEAVARDQSVVLPQAYVRFLGTMGIDAGDFLPGDHLLYPDILELKASARECLVESGLPGDLLEDCLVFAGNQGYAFLLLKTGDSEDPPVLRYVEDDLALERVHDRFSDWLATSIEDELRLTAQLGRP